MWLEQHNARMELEPLGAFDSFLSLLNKLKKGGVVSSTGTFAARFLVLCRLWRLVVTHAQAKFRPRLDCSRCCSSWTRRHWTDMIFIEPHPVSNQQCLGWEPVTACLVGEFKSLGLWHLITFTCSIGHPVPSVQLRELMRHGGWIRHQDLFACTMRTFKPRAASSAVECCYQEVCVTHGFLVTQQDFVRWYRCKLKDG